MFVIFMSACAAKDTGAACFIGQISPETDVFSLAVVLKCKALSNIWPSNEGKILNLSSFHF